LTSMKSKELKQCLECLLMAEMNTVSILNFVSATGPLEKEFNSDQRGQITTPAELLEDIFQPRSWIFQPGLNPGDSSGKSNPVT